MSKSRGTGIRRGKRSVRRRRGAAALDYVLIVATMLPIAAFVLRAGRDAIRLVYEMVCVLIAWPFM